MTSQLARRLASVKSTSFGYTGIYIYQPEDIKDAQVGYSIGLNGESFIDGLPGSWLKSWIVIGCEELCGAPIFVDVNVESLPVYTAMHGEGIWTPILIANSLEGLQRLLRLSRSLLPTELHQLNWKRTPYQFLNGMKSLI